VLIDTSKEPKTRYNAFINHLLHPHAIFDTRIGSMKSGY